MYIYNLVHGHRTTTEQHSMHDLTCLAIVLLIICVVCYVSPSLLLST